MNASPLTTTDATSQTLQKFTPRVPKGASSNQTALAIVEMRVTAQAPDGTSAVFFVRGGVKLVASAPTLVGTPDVVAVKDAGASSWTAALANASDGFEVVVTGAAATRIVWCVEAVEFLNGQRGGPEWIA